jgi:hypothetical protein
MCFSVYEWTTPLNSVNQLNFVIVKMLSLKLTEPSDFDEIPLCKILYFIRGTGLLAEYSRWETKQVKNGRGARVTLCGYHTHTDTGIYTVKRT